MKIPAPLILAVLLFLCQLPVFAQPAADTIATAIIKKHLLAVGGKEKYDSIWPVQKEGNQNYFGKPELP